MNEILPAYSIKTTPIYSKYPANRILVESVEMNSSEISLIEDNRQFNIKYLFYYPFFIAFVILCSCTAYLHANSKK